MLAIPNERMQPSDEPVILFAERASGSPQAVKVWFYPGDRIGNEFVYPKSQAMRIAKASGQSVLAMNDDSTTAGTVGEIPNNMMSAQLGRFDENGNWQSDDRTVAVNGTTPALAATIAPAPAATAPMAKTDTALPRMNAGQTAGTTGARETRRSLPKTASSLALYELLSGLALAGGLGVRQLRKVS